MKFIEVGSSPYSFTIRTYHPEADSHTYEEKPTIQKFLRVYMPWRRKVYCVGKDDFESCQPCWHVYWHRHPSFSGLGFARWGWN